MQKRAWFPVPRFWRSASVNAKETLAVDAEVHLRGGNLRQPDQECEMPRERHSPLRPSCFSVRAIRTIASESRFRDSSLRGEDVLKVCGLLVKKKDKSPR